MRWSRTLTLVEAHCEGDVGRVVTGGLIDIPGASMADKLHHVNTVDDSLRRFCVFEPRGSPQHSVNVLLPPTDPRADAAFLILQADGAHPMSGSNCVCVVTVLLETGMLVMHEPETRVVLDTPAGLVTALATCRDGVCERVTLDMPAAFVERLDVVIEVPGLGPVRADIAYGGCYYTLVDVAEVGLAVTAEHARALVDAGTRIHAAAVAQLQVAHPTIPAIDEISYVMFCGRDADDTSILRNATVVPGRLDRSPCGTGSAARVAAMHARGEIAVGSSLRARSVIGSEFQVDVIGTTEVAGRAAIDTRVSGRGWIWGIHQIGVAPDDPFPLGFALGDLWEGWR